MTNPGIIIGKLFLSLIVPMFLHIFTTADGCTPTVNGTVMTFDCGTLTDATDLNVYDFTLAELDAITSIVITISAAATTGPFTVIPPNICLFRNLQSIDFSRNLIVEPDPSESLTECSLNLAEIKLNSNRIQSFPSFMIYNMPNLVNLYFRNNLLEGVPLNAFPDPNRLKNLDFSFNRLDSFELWMFFVRENADLRNNPMTKVGNKYFVHFPYTSQILGNVKLSSTVNFTLTDAIFPMYDVCLEAVNLRSVLANQPDNGANRVLLYKLGYTDFGNTPFICNCDQYYIVSSLYDVTGESMMDDLPLMRGSCIDGGIFGNNTACDFRAGASQSTVDLTQAIPRFCRIDATEEGDLTADRNMTRPMSSLAANRYPRYVTRHASTGACFCTFDTTTTMSVRCLSGTVDSSLRWDNQTFPAGYLDNITRVNLIPLMSRLPSYLCTLPSREIDLRSLNFNSLTDATFSCLDTYQKVHLPFNQISSVQTSTGNFNTLEWLDLSSNNLTEIPVTLLRPSPSSLRYLDLRNNSIRQLDLILFTLRNITVLLDNNLINSTDYTNNANVTVTEFVTNSTVSGMNLSISLNLTNTFFTINDQQMLLARACTPSSIRATVAALSIFSGSPRLDCSCASIRIKLIFDQNGTRLTDTYTCRFATETDIFNGLTLANCSTAADISVCVSATYSTTPSSPTAAAMTSISTSTITVKAQADQTGLIVGLVVGLVGLAALIGLGVGLGFYFKNKAARNAASKPIGRPDVPGNGPEKPAQSRAATRNPRAVKLAPLSSIPSKLPAAPVATVVPSATSTTNPLARTESRPPTRGIPLRLDPIRSPTNVTPQYVPLQSTPSNGNTSSFRPIHGPSLEAKPSDTSTSRLRPTELLNIGGDSRN